MLTVLRAYKTSDFPGRFVTDDVFTAMLPLPGGRLECVGGHMTLEQLVAAPGIEGFVGFEDLVDEEGRTYTEIVTEHRYSFGR